MAKYGDPNFVLAYMCDDEKMFDILKYVHLKLKGTHSDFTNDFVQYYETVEPHMIHGYVFDVFYKDHCRSKCGRRTLPMLEKKLNEEKVIYCIYGIK